MCAQDSLLYGDRALNLRPGLQSSAFLANLFMRDGCVENGNVYYDLTDCQTKFMGGLLHTAGLRAALTEYLQRALALYAQRDASANGGNCTLDGMGDAQGVLLNQLGD